MDIFSKFLVCKVQSVSSSLYSIMLWTTRLPFPLKNPKQSPVQDQHDHKHQVGLKTLIYSDEAKQPSVGASIVHCYNLIETSKTSSLLPPPPPTSSLFSSSSTAFRTHVVDDLIGTESGDCMSSNYEDFKGVLDKPEPSYSNYSRLRRRDAAPRQFPPPISLLAESGNGKMPWVFKRECTEDGRLILRAERVKRREYLETYRENGRLVMRLVPVDDTVYCEECGHPMEEEEDEQVKDLEFNEEEEEEEVIEEEDAEEEELESHGCLWQKSCMENGLEPYGDLRKCFTYTGGFVRGSDPLGNSNEIGSDAKAYLGRPGSAPLRPMTTVM